MKPRIIVDDDGRVSRSKIGNRATRCACGSKSTYSSKKMAKAVAKRVSKEIGERLEAYHCYTSHCYHIGHPIGTKAS